MRNLDMTTLRSFLAVSEQGGVTRAAQVLNLTQSAVSMQLKRLEEMLGIELLDRTNRRVSLTASGEQLLTFARRIVDLNDEAVGRLSDEIYEGQIVIGVPHDIVYPVIPRVLKTFSSIYPRVNVVLKSSSTVKLHEELKHGEVNMILTTEERAGPGGETLAETPLKWVGALGGQAWKKRPLRLGFCKFCIFRPIVMRRLDAVGIDWELAIESDEDRSVEALISADLAVGALLETSIPPHLEAISAPGVLPELGVQQINLYGGNDRDEVMQKMAELLRHGYDATPPAMLRQA
ncbi:MAG: LysR family transcriptional regulator [Pseudomonadota bacterium]